MTVIQVLQKTPWLTSFQVCEILSKTEKDDRVEVREQIKFLVNAGKVKKTGKGKGCRYASWEADAYEEKELDTTKLKDQILKSFTIKSGNKTMNDLLSIGESKELTRQAVNELIECKSIEKRGKARWTCYYIFGEAPPENAKVASDSDVSKKSPPRGKKLARHRNPKIEIEDASPACEIDSSEEITTEIDVTPTMSAPDAMKEVLAGLKREKGFTLPQLTEKGFKLGANKFACSEELLKLANLGAVEYVMENNGDGTRAYYFMPEGS